MAGALRRRGAVSLGHRGQPARQKRRSLLLRVWGDDLEGLKERLRSRSRLDVACGRERWTRKLTVFAACGGLSKIQPKGGMVLQR